MRNNKVLFKINYFVQIHKIKIEIFDSISSKLNRNK